MVTRSPMSLSHLKFRHLMLVDLLVREGTLHKAARALHISQPAATAMLNDLEQLLGVLLFSRSRQGVMPTPAAASLLDKARTLLNDFDDFTDAVTRVTAGREVLLRVGVVPQAFVSYLPLAIERFQAADGCALRASEGTARQLLNLLFAGQLDCVVGRLPSEGLPENRNAADLVMVPLYREEVRLIARPGHPVLATERLRLADLAHQRWVLQRNDSSVRRALAEAFVREGLVPPDPAVETTTYIQNMAVVARSDLLSIAPRRAAEQQQALGQIVVLEIRLGVEPTQVNLMMRSGSGQRAMLELFKQALLDVVGQEASAPPQG